MQQYRFICGLILGIIIMYFLIEIKNNCFIKSNSKEQLNNIIKKLIRQAARWTTAAEQDENTMIAVLHATYGAGYLWALKDIATGEQIRVATGLDPKLFEAEIARVLDKSTRKMAQICPDYAPKKSYLTRVGGEGN